MELIIIGKESYEEDSMNRGELVLAKSCTGKPLARRIWKERENGVLICRDESYMAWKSAGVEPRVGELRVDAIFMYEQELLLKLESAYQQQADSRLQALWQQAKPYYESNIYQGSALGAD